MLGVAMVFDLNWHSMPAAPQYRQTALGGVRKRVFDILFSIIALILLAPIFALIAVVLKCTNSGPIFFVHQRVGLHGRTFGCIKFRTMRADGDRILERHLAENPDARREYEEFRKLQYDPRVVPVIGRVLRSASLDELPQFVNVLLGHMSVVGPRPVTSSEIDQHYEACAPDVLSARPGITGLWQVSGRSSLSYRHRVDLDVRYVRDWRLVSDIRVIVRTVGVLVSQRGAY